MDTEEAMNIIEEHGLVVRVNFYKATLDSLSRIIQLGDVSEVKKKKLEELYVQTLFESEKNINLLLESYRNNFGFCKIHFVPDYLFKEFVEGKRDSIFLNENLQLITNDDFPERFVFVSYDYVFQNSGPWYEETALQIRFSEYKTEISDYRSIRGAIPRTLKFTTGDFIKRLFRLSKSNRYDPGVKKLNRIFEKLSK